MRFDAGVPAPGHSGAYVCTPTEEIRDLQVEMTLVGGAVMVQRGAA